MRYPNTSIEKNLCSQGFKNIVGIDEAGRGAWAGPIVAACFQFDPTVKRIPGISDSKKLTADQRLKYYKWLTTNFIFGVGIISVELIDQIGIGKANKLAMIKAIESMPQSPDYLLIDAFKLNFNAPQQNIIKGDLKVWSIAAASIIAKVTRDQLMIDFDKEYNNYGFCRHKGYGTKEHQKQIDSHGICQLHRKSYLPIKNHL